MKLVVVVPFLNEEQYLPHLLESVASQTRSPTGLLLVDDGSIDGSRGIAEMFARQHSYARVLVRPVRPRERDRLVKAAELHAFQWAVEQVDGPWDVVAKLDADLLLTPGVFSSVVQQFEADPRLGMTGPYLSVQRQGKQAVRQRCPAGHVEGEITFYRRRCYEQISPLPAILGWDTIDEVRARMQGWRTATFEVPGGDPVHLRRMGSQDGLLRGYRRAGWAAYGYGSSPVLVLLGATNRLRDPPLGFAGANFLLGWMAAALQKQDRAEPELRKFVRQEQRRRIGRLLSQLSRGVLPDGAAKGVSRHRPAQFPPSR
ncbi:MAG: glycosyltransferase family 2 protein [Acidimicrobiales bacterium]